MVFVDLSPTQLTSFHKDGYVILKKFCSPQEVQRLHTMAMADDTMNENTLHLIDQAGKKIKFSLWFTSGDDVFGYLTRSEKVINSVYQLMDSDAPVCHFHTKVTCKEPRVGGAWEWHQDYGYWYKNGFMFPDQLMSVMVALTPAHRNNGCVQVIKGSHKMGRVNHGFAGEQVGADMMMVNNALKTMELVYLELTPGDAAFIHSNLLHCSAANLSDEPRLSLISCYSSQSNLAYNEVSESWQIPIDVVPNEAVLEWKSGSMAEARFLKKENDPALKETGWEKAGALL